MSKPIPSVFGSVFFPEMPVAQFFDEQWQPVSWQLSNSLTLNPASHCLHYGSEVFEGLKAFRHADDSIHIFRLEAHVERMQKSAQAMTLPVPDSKQLSKMIVELVRRAADDVPDARGALYLRPLLLGTDPLIGNAGHPSHNALLLVLASPSGDYFKQGSPLKILIETQHQRCAPHMGSIKTGGNYASALHWTMEAKAKFGAHQVLFCPGGDVQETGASNFLLIDGKTIITKPLTHEFLHGVTRRSVLPVAKEHGYTVEERDFSVDEIVDVISRGGEAALTGTAAVLAPVTCFVVNEQEIVVKNAQEGLTLRKLITDIQYGRSEDSYGWLTKVC